MKSTRRTKEEIAQSIWLLYKEISMLKERPALPRNASLEEKLDSHSSRWNSLYREMVTETFLFARHLVYPRKLYDMIQLISAADDKRSRAEQLLGYCTMPLMKVVLRRCSFGADANDCLEFMESFEKDLKLEFQSFAHKEKQDERWQGTGFSDKSRRIVNHYLRFKESVEKIAKNRAELSEQKIRTLYLRTHNHYNCTERGLDDLLTSSFQASVARGSDAMRKDKDGNEMSMFDAIPGGTSLDDEYIAKDQLKNSFDLVLRSMEELWQKKQRRAKPYFGALMTHWILDQTKEWCLPEDFYFQKLQSYSFIDKDLLMEFRTDGFIPERKVLLQRFPVFKRGQPVLDTAGNQKYKDEGRASNDMKGVLEKLREMLQDVHQDIMM